jgi:transcriptional regulator with XRE-family HTH domain
MKMKKRSEARRGRGDSRDADLGMRIRALRLERGLSQTALADSLNLTFQQVQKYEKGVNRVSATRLLQIAEILNVPVTFLYGSAAQTDTSDTDSVEAGLEFLTTAGAVRLLRAYAQMIPARRAVLAKLAEEIVK